MVSSGDLVGAGVLSTTFVLFLLAAELWRRWGAPEPEWTRKLVHLGGGLTCLLFPFLVSSSWVVLALALAMSGLFLAGGRLGLLRSLHGVARRSAGAEYYPLAIFLVFVLTRDKPWLYLAAVLVLAVGDAFAALIGSRYGVIRYSVEEDRKSLEGSLVFLVITFLAVHLPLLLMTGLDREICVLAAVLVAVLATGFEAISLGGADNLFVPLAVVVVLGKITTKPLTEVVYQNLSLLALCLAIAVLVWRFPYFNVGSTIAVMLYTYGTWSLADWRWAAPVLAGLVVYLVSWARVAAPRTTPTIRVRATARALLPPFSLLVMANSFAWYEQLLLPYLAATAMVLAFCLAGPVLKLSAATPRQLGARALVAAVLASATVCLPCWIIAQPVSPAAAAAMLAVVLLCLVADAVVARVSTLQDTGQWRASQFLLTYAAAGMVLVAELLVW